MEAHAARAATSWVSSIGVGGGQAGQGGPNHALARLGLWSCGSGQSRAARAWGGLMGRHVMPTTCRMPLSSNEAFTKVMPYHQGS